MKPRKLILGSLLSLAIGACASAGEPAIGTIELFDGETLDGWRISAENPQSFRVEDGSIVADGPRAHLFYEGGRFEDFELSLTVMTMPDANSGVYFHTAYQDEGWPAAGFEAQVNASYSDPRKTGSLYGIADIRVDPDEELPVIGFAESTYASLPEPPHADGVWFDYVIRVEDRVVTIRIDGRLMVRWTLPDDADSGRAPGDGRIALQAHHEGSVVYYRDIRLTPLS